MGEAGIEMAEFGESAENGLEASNEFGDASDLNDNLREAKEGIKELEGPEIEKIKEDLDRQLSENAADINEKAKNYQNSEGRFHEKLSNTIEKQTGTKISKNEMENAVKNYKPGERSGNTKQDAVNETLDKATQNLKDNLPADSKTFTDRLKSLVNSTNEVAGKIFKGYAGLSIIGVISALIYRALKKDKTLDEIVQGAAGVIRK